MLWKVNLLSDSRTHHAQSDISHFATHLIDERSSHGSTTKWITRPGYLNSSQTYREQYAVLRACQERQIKLLYVAPEQLLTERF